MIPALIYLLCGLTSGLCAILLLRSYSRSGSRLLLWSGIGFSAFTANNILLFLDIIIFTHTDLSLYRDLTALVGVGLLLYGMIWES